MKKKIKKEKYNFQKESNKLIQLAQKHIPNIDIYGCSTDKDPFNNPYTSIRLTSINTPNTQEFITQTIKYANLFKNRTINLSQTNQNNTKYPIVADIHVYH